MSRIDEGDLRYGEQYLKATNAVLEAIAKFLGREDELQIFLSKREKLFNALNGVSDDSAYSYEDYQKSIPYWVKAVEASIAGLYEQGLKDASRPSYHSNESVANKAP